MYQIFLYSLKDKITKPDMKKKLFAFKIFFSFKAISLWTHTFWIIRIKTLFIKISIFFQTSIALDTYNWQKDFLYTYVLTKYFLEIIITIYFSYIVLLNTKQNLRSTLRSLINNVFSVQFYDVFLPVNKISEDMSSSR